MQTVTLTACNISYAASDMTHWFDDSDHVATLSATTVAAIASARAYLATAGSAAHYVSLVAGIEAPTVEAAMPEDWDEGVCELRVFPERGVFWYQSHDHNCDAWIEFEVLNSNGEAM